MVGSAAIGVAIAFTNTPSVVEPPFSRHYSISLQLPDEEVVPASSTLEPEYKEPLPENDDEFDPICRVVASSDNKLPPNIVSKLSPSSKHLLLKLDMLYAAKSKRELRELSYLQPDTLALDSNKKDSEKVSPYDYDTEEAKLISILKKSLQDGGYKLMDNRDLDLCSALNAGYLLRLSLSPDLKNLDCIAKEFYPDLETNGGVEFGQLKQLILDGKVLLFRRGYTKEITTGRLLLPKLDYLQTSLVQKSAESITRILAAFERRREESISKVAKRVNDYAQRANQRLLQAWSDLVYTAFDSVGVSNSSFVARILPKNDTVELNNNITNSLDSQSDSKVTTTFVRGNKIFKLNRYELGSSFDINDATILCEMGNETCPVERDIYDAIDAGQIESASKYNGTVRLLERISIENCVDYFSRKGRRELVTNYVRYSRLVEPSYEEVVVIWRPSKKKKLKRITTPRWMYDAAKIFDMEDRLPKRKNATSKDIDDEMNDIQIRCFNDVPMANIYAVLPKNKLIFRPADAFVFDFVSVATFLATAGSLKFDSPKVRV